MPDTEYDLSGSPEVGKSVIEPVRIEMPVVSICCPRCHREDDHANVFSPTEDSYTLGEGVTYCEYCEEWFNVVLEP